MSFAVWTTALVLIISVGGLGWTENGNDYSRYLPRNTPGPGRSGPRPWAARSRRSSWNCWVCSPSRSRRRLVGITQIGVPQSFPSWFVTPFLIFAIFQLLAINTIDMYSSGVTLQALGVPVRRWGAVIIDTVVCAVVTGFILFHGNFYTDFAGFLLYIVVWLAPWFAILMTDYLLRGRRYDSLSLRSPRDGLYWRNGGIHWPAIIAQVVGMVAALMWINAGTAYPAYTGPISNHFPAWRAGTSAGPSAWWSAR